MTEMKRVFLGTWQFDRISESDAISLVATAHDMGISQFDTAYVYAGGRAEQILGEELYASDTVVTKIPATSKQELAETLAYPTSYMAQCIQTSIERLERAPDVLLLHNWHPEWEGGDTTVVGRLRQLAMAWGVGRIGISLPNAYQGHIEDSPYFNEIDCLEAPYNRESPELTLARLTNLAIHKQVLARSLFMQGRETSNMGQKLETVLASGCNPVLGATKPEQINMWSKMIWQK